MNAPHVQPNAALPTPTDPEGVFVGKVHVVVEGREDAPAVCMVHGIPGSTRDFRYLAPAVVDAGMRAVRVDMPGFGKTPVSAFETTTMPERAAFLRQVMRATGHGRFAILGHSFGGGIAMMCASLFPDDVRALCAVNSLGPRRHRGFGAPLAVIRGIARALDVPGVGPALHRFVSAGYAANGLKSDGGLDIAVLKWHLTLVGDVDFKELRLAARSVRCPSLVVSAQNDPLVEPPCAFTLARMLATSAPLVSHLHVERGGHFLQKHRAREIARWLARVLG